MNAEPDNSGSVAAADPIAGSPVYPVGSPRERARPPRDRRLRRGRARGASSARPPTSTPRTTCAPGPARTCDAFAARTDDFEVLYASKALPLTAAYRLIARGGALGRRRLRRRAAHGAARPASTRRGSTCTATTRPRPSSATPFDAGVGHLILDSFDEIERAERLLDRPQDVLIRVTPGIKPSTHDYVQTGQLDSKFGFGLEDGLAAAGDRAGAARRDTSTWSACTPTSARRSSSSSPTCRRSRRSPSSATRRLVPARSTSAAASASPTRPTDEPPSIEDYVDVKVERRAARSSTRRRGSWSSRAARWSATPA